MGRRKSQNSIRGRVLKHEKNIKQFFHSGITSPMQIAKKLNELELIPNVSLEGARKEISKFLRRENLLPGVVTSTDKVKWEEDYENGVASFDYSGLKKIQTQEDLIRFAKIDTSKWKAVKQTANKWGENYQIKVVFESVDKHAQEKELYDRAFEALKEHLADRKVLKKKNKKTITNVGVIPLADFHIGAYIRNLIRTPNYDLDILTNMLEEVATTINELEYSEVHIIFLGDIIESFTGVNHPNTWKELMRGGYGSNIVITAYEILENFLNKIENLHSLYLVSGNHDRVTASNKEDTKGEVVELISHFLKKQLSVNVIYHPILISQIIDNICYIFTHGHHNFTKKSLEHIIWKYGKQGYFNLVLQGHWHTRRKKEPVVNMQTIYSDSGDYRGITCPSLFTGNFYSETSGFTSTAGFLIVQNKHNKPAIFDIPLD